MDFVFMYIHMQMLCVLIVRWFQVKCHRGLICRCTWDALFVVIRLEIAVLSTCWWDKLSMFHFFHITLKIWIITFRWHWKNLINVERVYLNSIRHWNNVVSNLGYCKWAITFVFLFIKKNLTISPGLMRYLAAGRSFECSSVRILVWDNDFSISTRTCCSFESVNLCSIWLGRC